MAAVGRFQVQTLLVDRNFRDPGWACPSCNWASLVEVEACPLCGGKPQPVADAVGEIVRQAVLQNVRVEVGEGIPALDELKGVGGLLRYS
jgi:hypothetical protein